MYKGPLAAHALEARAWGASLCGMPAPVLRRTRVGTHSCAGGREEEGGKEGRRERERERERERREKRERERARVLSPLGSGCKCSPLPPSASLFLPFPPSPLPPSASLFLPFPPVSLPLSLPPSLTPSLPQSLPLSRRSRLECLCNYARTCTNKRVYAHTCMNAHICLCSQGNEKGGVIYHVNVLHKKMQKKKRFSV